MQKTTITLVDDLDGRTLAAGTTSFSLDGQDYEIDLNPEHMTEFHAKVASWAHHARRTVPRRQRHSSGRSAEIRRWSGRVRDWALAHNYDIATGGRIRDEIKRQYMHDTGDLRPAR